MPSYATATCDRRPFGRRRRVREECRFHCEPTRLGLSNQDPQGREDNEKGEEADENKDEKEDGDGQRRKSSCVSRKQLRFDKLQFLSPYSSCNVENMARPRLEL